MKYNEYKLNTKERLFVLFEFAGICGMISYLFYDSPWFLLLAVPLFFLYTKRKKRKLKEKRQSEIKDEFIQMIQSMATALTAGYSIENSLKEALNDMKNMYENESVVVKEMEQILSRMENGSRIEEEISDFAERTGIEEIKDFSNVFSIAKKSGGKFSDIIRNCASIMRSNRDTESEIQILISGKQFEQRIMNVIPFALIMCLRLTSPGLIGVLYHNVFGIIVMSVCLSIYISALFLAEKISDIKC